jgi:hypothetical protein
MLLAGAADSRLLGKRGTESRRKSRPIGNSPRANCSAGRSQYCLNERNEKFAFVENLCKTCLHGI